MYEEALARVQAPEELWRRIAQDSPGPPAGLLHRALRAKKLTWALAAAALFTAIAWNLPQPDFQSHDPAQIRAWVKEKTGLDLPLAHSAAVQVTGARLKHNTIEISYLAGNRRGSIAVSQTEPAHWSASYAVACDFEAACKLCHAEPELN